MLGMREGPAGGAGLLWGLSLGRNGFRYGISTLREDITYRLPELDPRGSDEENLDSETSASTESLLEERGARGGVEGQCEGGIR